MGRNSQLSMNIGVRNTTVGSLTLQNAQDTGSGTPNDNTAIGYGALSDVTMGYQNTALGKDAGDKISTGHSNVLVGHNCDVDTATRVRAVGLGQGLSTHASDSSFRVVGDNGVYHSGNTTTWSTISDERIKKDIVDSTVGLAEINKIKIRNFKYRTASEITASELQEYDLDQLAVNNTNTQVGVIAQEFETVFPNSINVDDRGIKNVNEDELLFAMVKAIQELSAKVTALEAG